MEAYLEMVRFQLPNFSETNKAPILWFIYVHVTDKPRHLEGRLALQVLEPEEWQWGSVAWVSTPSGTRKGDSSLSQLLLKAYK